MKTLNTKKGKILIDIGKSLSSVALLEDGRLNEYYVEYGQQNRMSGNIYKGRVMNVLQGLQTAFVDIGFEKNGFLYVGETLDDRSDLRKSGVIPDRLNVAENDIVMVQVTKEETKTKGARLSLNLSLPGRYVVYLPTIDFVGISNKITDEKTREKLQKLLQKFKENGEGFIARTNCMDAKKSEIISEAMQMKELYSEIRERFLAAEKVPAILHSEGDLLFRVLRDMLSPDTEEIICNDFRTCEKLKESFLRQKSPFYEKVKFYESDYDVMDVFGVLKELEKILERKVELPSGGYLVIDKTEALTSIDVNTGKYRGEGDHEETVYKTNLEAAREIARQIRLRNIGGIIVVDFIDMIMEENRAAVVETLRKETFYDRIKTRVLDMSGLGLVEIARRKTGNEISDFLLDECPSCRGNAHTHSAKYMERKLMAKLKRFFAENNYKNAVVTISALYAGKIAGSGAFEEYFANAWRDKLIYLVPKESMNFGDITVSGSNSPYLDLPPGAKLLY